MFTFAKHDTCLWCRVFCQENILVFQDNMKSFVKQKRCFVLLGVVLGHAAWKQTQPAHSDRVPPFLWFTIMIRVTIKIIIIIIIIVIMIIAYYCRHGHGHGYPHRHRPSDVERAVVFSNIALRKSSQWPKCQRLDVLNSNRKWCHTG